MEKTLTSITRDHRRDDAFTVGRTVSFDTSGISLRESLDTLAGQLLRLGWTVRVPRMAPDSRVGVLAVSARAFSSPELVEVDSQRRLSLVTSGESLPVSDAAELVRVLRRRQATSMASSLEAVPA